jgi:hypothetical protein
VELFFFGERNMSDKQLLLVTGVSFLIMITWGMRIYKKKWDKLCVPFPTDLKIPIFTNNRKIIHIDEDAFKKVSIEILPNGLLMAQYGLLPRLFIPGLILIPWKAFSPIYSTEKKVMMFSFTEYFSDIKIHEGKVKLQLPKEVAEEILTRHFVERAA